MLTLLKQTCLRYLIGGSSLMLLLSNSGCSEDNGTLIDLDIRYVNNSSKTITISHYGKGNNVINSLVPETLTIKSGESASFYNTKVETTQDDADISDFENYIIKNRLYDSAYLNFADEKFVIYSKGELNTKIFAIENFEGIENPQNNFTFTYEFTEADYNAADEIGG